MQDFKLNKEFTHILFLIESAGLPLKKTEAGILEKN